MLARTPRGISTTSAIETRSKVRGRYPFPQAAFGEAATQV